MRRVFCLLLLFNGIFTLLGAQEKQFILPNNEKLLFQGAFFIEKSNEKTTINRHDEEFLSHPKTYLNRDKANTQSGVTLTFTTNSPEVIIHFEKRTDSQLRQNRFGIFKNGEFVGEKHGSSFTVINNTENDFVEWKIVLPIFYGVNFKGIEINKNASLKKTHSIKEQVYVAIGNSITHGVGQDGAAYLSYPYLLAELKNWQLYNLAVGGSKISWPVANLLKGKKVDVISVLWGYNDWNSTFSLVDDIVPNYKMLLKTLRKVQPDARIYCILPTCSRRKTPKSGNDSLEDIRKCQLEIIRELQKKGDKNLQVINGKDITTENDLKDDVHLSVKGARNFALKLELLIR